MTGTVGTVTDEPSDGTGPLDNPFPGPRPFAEKENELFFGREGELADLVALLFAHRAVLLHAPSGAGKSSLVKAGLIPRAGREGFEFLVGRLRDLTPRGDDELEALGNRYVRNLVDNWRGQGLPIPPGTTTLAEVLRGLPPPAKPRRVVVLDQFEELFVLHPEAWRDRPDLLRQVQVALDHDPSLHMLFVLRDDYLAQLQPLTFLLRDRLSTRYHLRGLSSAQALEAVVRPFEATGRRFAPGVGEALVKALRAQPPVEPGGPSYEGEEIEPVQLQIVCRTFFRRLSPEVAEIDADDLERHADLGQALTDFYEEAVAAAVERQPGVGESRVRQWFERHLITSAGTRAIVFRDLSTGTTAGLPNEMVDELEGQRLIRSEPRGRDTWYELAHDTLIKPVQAANRAWRDEHLSPLQKQAELWDDGRRGEGLLLRGEALEEAAEWAEAHEHDLSSTEREFLAASRRAADREKREREIALKLRVFTVIVVVLLILAVIATIQARSSASDARRAAALAKAQEFLSAAETTHTTDPTLSLLLTRAAFERLQSSDRPQASAAQAALYEAVHHGPDRLISTLPDFAARGADFSPDGRLVVTAGNDGKARIWDVTEGRQRSITEPGHSGPVNDVVFSGDGKRIATGSEDGTARLWDVGSGRQVGQFAPAEEGAALPALNGIAFSPDQNRLATADAAGNAAVWDIASTTRVVPAITHPPAAYAVAFSPDSTRLATAGEDGTATVWDVATAQPVMAVPAGAPKTADEGVKRVNAVAFSPDGGRLATASTSGRASVWEIGSRRELLVLSVAVGVNDIGFSGDGTRLTTAAERGVGAVWDADTGRMAFAVGSGQASLGSASFSPDGSRVVTTSGEAAPAMWEASGGQIEGHTASVYAAAFDPDGGDRIATASADGTATVWSLGANPEELSVLSGHAGEVNDVAFSLDGTRLATGGDDNMAKVWDAASGDELVTLRGHGDRVRGVAFTPDGTRLVTASADQAAKIWDLPSGREIATLSPHQGQLWDVAISPDGSRLATAGADGTAKVWDTGSATEILTVPGHKDAARAVAFSPDGKRLATGGMDRFARLWDLATGAELKVLPGGDFAVLDVAFSPDGTQLATVGEGGLAQLWTPDSPTVSLTPVGLRGHALSVFGVAFSPDGTRLVTTSGDQTAQVWNTQSAERVTTLAGPRRGHTAAIKDARFSRDGKWLATASVDGTVKLWDTRGQERQGAGGDPVTLPGHTGGINAVAFSPDGKQLATASDDKTARLWDLETREERKVLVGHERRVNAVDFSPDGTRVVTGGEDRTARLWNVETGEQQQQFTGHEGPVTAVDFSPDGTRVVTGGEDGTARLWNVDSGAEVPFAPEVPRIPGNRAPFSGIAFSPDGKTIATAAVDGTATIWDVSSGEPKTGLPNHDRMPLYDIAFSPDGKQVAAAGRRGLLVWSTSSPTERMSIRQPSTVEGVAFSPDGDHVVAAGAGNQFYVYAWQRGTLLEFADDLPARVFSEEECQRFFNRSCG